MNLTTEAWIPALRADGTRHLFSLQALFAEAHQLRDLAVKPHERIALMRLLLCITQAALDGPADQDEWEECRDDIQPSVSAYLDRWRASFELFGAGPRFLQFKPGTLAETTPCMTNESITRLDLALASGDSTPTLFDNAADGLGRSFSEARAALCLLTYQCYSPLLGRGYKGRAPCSDASGVHAFLGAKNLLGTLHANILPDETIEDIYGAGNKGRPVWEFQSPNTLRATPSPLTTTFLGRLVPIARSIWLQSERAISLSNGIVYEGFEKTSYREASVTLVERAEGKLSVLRCSTTRATWRDLAAMYVSKKATNGAKLGGPLALQIVSVAQNHSLWCGGMIFPKDQAKIAEVVESQYSVPPELFDPFGQAAYEAGVAHAETAATNLGKAIGSYSAALKIDSPAYEKGRQDFWTTVEQSLDALFAAAREKTPPEAFAASPWGRAVRDAALAAYERTCPRRTPRQLQAYATGLRLLHAAPAANQSTKKTRRKNS